MMVSNQQTHVEHNFEHIRERDITAVHGHSTQDPDSARSAPQKALKFAKPEHSESEDYSLSLTPDLMLKKKLIESVTGERIENYADILNHQRLLPLAEKSVALLAAQYGDVFMLDGHKVTDASRLSVKERLYEYEELNYSTRFSLETADGQTRELSLSVSFSRELDITREMTMTAAEFKDPLVLNLNRKGTLFGDDTFDFDLQGDGVTERLPELEKGVWFLAHDRNNNGVIDNGTELFGATTGNGFAELAAYDHDGNGIVDKRDGGYIDLQLWDGKNQLKSLQSGGVAALSLAAADTPFTFTDPLGNPTAQLRQTSVFIDEQHRPGAIHQIDIAV